MERRKRWRAKCRETPGRPSCKPVRDGNHWRSGNFDRFGRRACRANRKPETKGSKKRDKPNRTRINGTPSNRTRGASIMVWTLHESKGHICKALDSFTRRRERTANRLNRLLSLCGQRRGECTHPGEGQQIENGVGNHDSDKGAWHVQHKLYFGLFERNWIQKAHFKERQQTSHSCLELKNEVKAQAKDVEIIMQESPTGDHSANWSVEVAVQDEKCQARALLSELEENLGKLEDTHPLLTWLSRHAAFCLGRFSIQDDGRYPFQRLTGQKWNRPMVTFGEKIYFRPLDAYKSKDNEMERKEGDLGRRVLSGHYVGTHGRNADVIVMTTQGVIKGNTIHRKPEAERWDRSELKDLKGVPWKLRPRSEEGAEHRLHIKLPETTRRLTPSTRDGGPRQLYVRKKDLEREDGTMDYTPGCRGCEALMIGFPAVTHNAPPGWELNFALRRQKTVRKGWQM